jgi:hypothetical protein
MAEDETRNFKEVSKDQLNLPAVFKPNRMDSPESCQLSQHNRMLLGTLIFAVIS